MWSDPGCPHSTWKQLWEVLQRAASAALAAALNNRSEGASCSHVRWKRGVTAAESRQSNGLICSTQKWTVFFDTTHQVILLSLFYDFRHYVEFCWDLISCLVRLKVLLKVKSRPKCSNRWVRWNHHISSLSGFNQCPLSFYREWTPVVASLVWFFFFWRNEQIAFHLWVWSERSVIFSSCRCWNALRDVMNIHLKCILSRY